MRWPNTYRHDPRSIIDKYNIYFQTIERLRVKMWAGGSPCIYWKNTSFDEFGVFNTNTVKCYCYTHNNSQPNPRHPLCMGTGVLSGYQRYGYKEEVYASPSIGGSIISNSQIQTSSDGVSMSIAGTALTVDIFTAPLSMTRFKEVDRILANDYCDLANNNIEYAYSTDNTTWTNLTFKYYEKPTSDVNAQIASKIADVPSLPEGTEKIYFRFRLKKRVAASSSPIFNSFRFRYRTMKKLQDISPRHKINYPAFLADREQQKVIIEGGDNNGWQTKYPLAWWVLPEVKISNYDIIEFQTGLYKGRKFSISWLERRFSGPEQVHTSTSFEASLIRDNNDLLGILSYLK